MDENETIKFENSIVSGDGVYNEERQIFYRAVKDAKEAYDLCRELVDDNDERNSRNANIARRLNDEQPFDPKKLKSNNQDWRSNYSSGFLSGLINKAMPSYKQVVDGAKTLTMSTLADTSAEGEEKSDIFQSEITKTIRRWSGWSDLVTQIAMENLAYGYTAAIRPDEIDWRPFFARQDEVFFPDNCPQQADKVPFFMYKQSFYLYELAEKVAEPDRYGAVGWNIPNLIKLLNNSEEENRATGTDENARDYEDVLRENTVGGTFTKKGARVVEAYHLLIREVSGLVSHWVVSAKDGKEMFVYLDRFESMEDCLALFSLETGSGTIHSSKGVGRRLYNRAVVIERSRNLAQDNLYLSGLIVLRALNEALTDASVTVTHPYMLIDGGYEISNQKIESNVDAFFQMDQYNVKLAEAQVGSLLPSAQDIVSSDATASAINLAASVEQQIREGILLRFWNQMVSMIYMMQKAICSPDNIQRAVEINAKMNQPGVVRITKAMWNFIQKIGATLTGQTPLVDEADGAYDNEAIDCLLNMLIKGLKPEDIFELATCPPQQVVEDMAARNAQLIDQLVARYLGDPSIDQQVMKEEDISSKLGYTAAKRWVIPQDDNTRAVEAARQQIEELVVMFNGMPVPVSPRDPDAIHLRVIQERAQEFLKKAANMQVTPDVLMGLDAVVKHAEEHVQSAMAKGVNQAEIAEEIQFVQLARQMLNQAGATSPAQGATAPGGLPADGGNVAGDGTLRQEQVPLTPQPSNPSVQGSESLPSFPQGMTPSQAVSQKPLSRTAFNLTPGTKNEAS